MFYRLLSTLNSFFNNQELDVYMFKHVEFLLLENRIVNLLL